MVSLAPLEITVTADTARAEAGLERVQGQLQDTGQAATRSAGRVRTAGMAMGAVGPAAAKANPALRNMSMQLSQVAQQGAVTGNYLQALITQVPDLALGFGAVGIAAGALVPIVYGVAQGFLSASGAVKDMDDALQGAKSSLQEYLTLISDRDKFSADIFEGSVEQINLVSQAYKDLIAIARIEALNAISDATASLADSVLSYSYSLGEIGDAGNLLEIETQLQGNITSWQENRDQVRQFTDQLKAMANAPTLEAQYVEATRLRDQFTSIVDVNGQMTDRQLEFYRSLSQTIYQMELLGAATDAEVQALAQVEAEAYSVQDAINAITDATGGAVGAANELTTAWSNVATNAWEAAKAMAAARVRNDGMTGSEVAELAGQYAAYGQGRQAFDQSASEIRYAPPAPNVVTAGAGGGGGGGGGSGGAGGGAGGVNPIIAELEAVQQALMTQEELQIQSFERQQETLQSALEQRMLTQNQYNELMQAAQEQHAAAMTEIDAYRYGSQLDMAETFFGDAANALASGNDKMVEISRKFAAIEATINAGRAFAQVASDPKLPWFAKIPAALGVASAISQFASSSGIGSATAAATAPAAAQQAQTSQQVSNFNVVIEGQSISTGQFGNLIDQINEEARNGGRIFIRAIEG